MEKQRNVPTLRNALKREFKKDHGPVRPDFISAHNDCDFYCALFVPRASFTDGNIMDQYLAPMTDGHIFELTMVYDIFALLLVAARTR